MPPAEGHNGRRHAQRRPYFHAYRDWLALATGTCLIAAAFAGTLWSAPSDASASSKGSSGTLVLNGYVSGTLKVPAFLPPGKFTTGCQISPAQAGTVILQWDTAKLDVSGKPKTLNNIDVQVTVQSFGHRYSMNLNSYGESPATVTFQSNMPFGWSSVSGSLTTTKSGGGGSMSGTMTAGKQHPGTVTIKGDWAGCAKLA